MIFLVISYLIQFITLSVGFKNRKYFKNTIESYFLLYVAFAFLNQMLELLHKIYLKTATYYYFNLYDIVTFLFFIMWFHKVLKNRIVIYIFGSLYLVSLFVSLALEDFTNDYLDINTIAGTIMILFFVMIFYSSLLKKDRIIAFASDSKFWISTGLMVFYIGYFPISILLNLENFSSKDVDIIVLILNWIMYGCFIKAFLCFKKITK